MIGKGHRHRDTAHSKVTLREVVEIAKSHEATTFANKLMKNARGTHQEQVNFTKKTTPGNRSSDTLTAACFWCRGDHPILSTESKAFERSKKITSVVKLLFLVACKTKITIGKDFPFKKPNWTEIKTSFVFWTSCFLTIISHTLHTTDVCETGW